MRLARFLLGLALVVIMTTTLVLAMYGAAVYVLRQDGYLQCQFTEKARADG